MDRVLGHCPALRPPFVLDASARGLSVEPNQEGERVDRSSEDASECRGKFLRVGGGAMKEGERVGGKEDRAHELRASGMLTYGPYASQLMFPTPLLSICPFSTTQRVLIHAHTLQNSPTQFPTCTFQAPNMSLSTSHLITITIHCVHIYMN